MGLKKHKYHIPKKRLPPYTLLTAPRKPRRRLDLLTRRCEIAYSRCNLAELDKIAPDRIKNHLDLNIIENLGSYGQRDRQEKNIADIDDLRKRLGEIWNNIQLDTIRAPLAGVPRRLAECVKLRGKRTAY